MPCVLPYIVHRKLGNARLIYVTLLALHMFLGCHVEMLSAVVTGS
jgi:hypothetical protein